MPGVSSASLRPVRLLVASLLAFILYVLASDLWRFGATTPGVDDSARPTFKAMAVSLATLVLLGHGSRTARWLTARFAAWIWPVATVAAAAAYSWGLTTGWGHRCNQCTIWGAITLVGGAALASGTALKLFFVVQTVIRRPRPFP